MPCSVARSFSYVEILTLCFFLQTELLEEGKEYAVMLYNWRCCSRALPQVGPYFILFFSEGQISERSPRIQLDSETSHQHPIGLKCYGSPGILTYLCLIVQNLIWLCTIYNKNNTLVFP